MKSTLFLVEPVVKLRSRLHARLFQDFEMVGGAADGMGALKGCVNVSPQIVLMEVVLPDLSGIEVIEKLKGILPALPRIILWTAVRNDRWLVQGLSVGASDYLDKLVAKDIIVDVLRPTGELQTSTQTP